MENTALTEKNKYMSYHESMQIKSFLKDLNSYKFIYVKFLNPLLRISEMFAISHFNLQMSSIPEATEDIWIKWTILKLRTYNAG